MKRIKLAVVLTLSIFGPLGYILAISPVTPAIQYFGVPMCVFYAAVISLVSGWLLSGAVEAYSA